MSRPVFLIGETAVPRTNGSRVRFLVKGTYLGLEVLSPALATACTKGNRSMCLSPIDVSFPCSLPLFLKNQLKIIIKTL